MKTIKGITGTVASFGDRASIVQRKGKNHMTRLSRLAVPLVFIGAALAQPAGATEPVSPANWPQAGMNPAHTGYNKKETVIGRKNVGSLTQKWMVAADSVISASPVEMGGTVYMLSTNGTLYAVDAASGDVKWTVAAGEPYNYGTSAEAVIAGKTLIYSSCVVDSGHSGVCAYNPGTGALVWSYELTTYGGQATNSILNSQPMLAGNRLFFGIQVNQYAFVMTALDAATGAVVWQNGAIPASPPPAASGGVIIGAFNVGGYAICALSQATGAQAWCTDLPYNGFNQAVTIASGLALFETVPSGGGTNLTALDVKTGNLVWQTPESITAGPLPAPAVARGIAYFSVGSNDYSDLFALDLKTGAQIWHYAGGGAAGYLASTGVSVANGVTYGLCPKGGNGNQCAFDAKTGAVLQSEGGGGDGAPPLVVNGVEIYVCGNTNLCAAAP